MDPALYLRDLEAKPAVLHALADRIDDIEWPVAPTQRLLLAGMGSSWFAADTAARRMRRAGIAAVADLASVDASYPAAADLAVVGITASGGSAETLRLLRAHHGTSTTIALTNTAGLDLPVDHTVLLHAGAEVGGVACRSYLHTLVLLLRLEHQLAGTVPGLADAVHAAADAAQHLLDTRADWLPALSDVLGGPHGTWLLAPAERLGNALQGALMLREGPRRAADGCETGDWSHVDVYLTKTLDYRALLLSGSRYDGAAAQWMRDRGSRFAIVGPPTVDVAELVLRHPGDDDPLVALLTEVLVPELLGAHWWAAG
jgi:glucosamine--fructose-6-phosphate aminotransferase (isomerizing)